jgi:hypothetical protein
VTLRAVGACPRLSEAANLPLRPGGGRLSGDVDGDGHADRVSIRYAPRARASCGFLLMARTRSGVLSARVPEWYKPRQDLRMRDWPFPEPYLGAVVQLHPRRAQIVVARWHGAAVADVSLYGAVGGKLVLLRFRPRTYQDELPLFGTVGTGSTNALCVRGGPLIVLTTGPAGATGTRWSISRSEYRLIRDRLSQTRTRRVTSSRKNIESLADRWGMDDLPFTGCTIERGRRL